MEILSWNLCFENKRQEGGWGVCVCVCVCGGGVLWLTCFHCGIIMMIKSLLQSYSKQWYVHSCGDGQSTGCCLLSLSTLPDAFDDDSHSHNINLWHTHTHTHANRDSLDSRRCFNPGTTGAQANNKHLSDDFHPPSIHL